MLVLGWADGFVLRVADLVFSADTAGKGRKVFAQSCSEQTVSRLKTVILVLQQSKLALDMSQPYLSDF